MRARPSASPSPPAPAPAPRGAGADRLSDAVATIRLVRPLLLHLQARGCDVHALLGACGIEPARVFEADARIPHRALAELWARAEAITDDPALAAHTLTTMDVRMVDLRSRVSEYVSLHAFANSDDVGAGLARFARFYPLVHSALRITCARSRRGTSLTLRQGDAEPLPASLVEFLVGSIPRMVAATTRPAVAPDEVLFSHVPRAGAAVYERLFRAPVRVSAGTNGVRFGAQAWRAPLTTRDPVLAEIAQRQAMGALERLVSGDALRMRARACIEAGLRSGHATLPAVAGRLGISTRTLARRLAAEGAGFKRMVDDVRMARAEQHLDVERRSVRDVAALLGFADASAFSRAYKRWFGALPGHRPR